MKYEYGIAHYKHDPNGPVEEEQGPHRDNMTLHEAQDWLETWKEMGGKQDAFYIIRRPKGDWEAFEGVPEHRRTDFVRRIRSRKEIERESIWDKTASNAKPIG
jgi:hypothetical protein